ncbi:MAG: SPOR domain-containing protein [Bryobacteraceae bacterium]|nr:SPOR domain-containing protein [Bryobacteraceae bacterium]
MAVRSEGEFELVLGNRQLFSVLGIVVILLGIFFAMGFFAGKSVGQASANNAAPRHTGDQNPLVVDSPQAAPPAATPAPPVTAEPEPAAAPPIDSSTKKEEKPAVSEKKEAAAKKAESSAAKPVASKGADQVVAPAAGSYLQVASTRLSEAQSLAALLRRHGFHAVLAESPKAELVRVLVGPFSSPEATTEARAKLKNLDIAKPYPVKY